MAYPQPPMSTQQYANAINRAVRKHFVDDYKKAEPEMEKLFTVETQEDYNELEADYTGLAPLTVISEGAVYPKDAPFEGYLTTYTPAKLGNVVQVTKEMMLADKAGIADPKKIARSQARVVSDAIQRQGASMFGRGFNTSYTSYGDAKPLFSTTHTRIDGGTAGINASSTGITLTHDNLEEAVVQMREVYDGRGVLAMSTPKILLVPPRLEQEALIITKSTNRSATADNDINPFNMKEYSGGQMRVIVWDYLGSTMSYGNSTSGSDTAWFLIDPTTAKLKWKWFWKPTIGQESDEVGFMNDTLHIKTSYSASFGWSDWRGVWGSKGDSAAYSS